MKAELFKFPLPDGWQENHDPKVEIPFYGPPKVFVRELRRALGVTQETFCVYLNYACSPMNPLYPGYAIRTISRWETGKYHPNYWFEERVLKGFAWQIWSFRDDRKEQAHKGWLWETSDFLNAYKGVPL